MKEEDIVLKYIKANTYTRKQLEAEIKNMKPGWQEFFDDNKDEIDEIFNKIGKPWYFPKREGVFRFCKEIALEEVKVVVVGMDPYNTYTVENDTIVPDATGRSFEVNGAKSWIEKGLNPSLQNIFRVLYYVKTGETDKKYTEIREGLSKEGKSVMKFCESNPSEWFEKTVKNGTLWLNAYLTVEPYNAGAHKKHWKEFMEKLIIHIHENIDPVWVLLGKDAQKLLDKLVKNGKTESIIIIRAKHPCYPNKTGFVEEMVEHLEGIKNSKEKDAWDGLPFTIK